jgi:hypothetical protein
MLSEEHRNLCRSLYAVLSVSPPLHRYRRIEMTAAHTVETLRAEIERIVAERQELRARSASADELEQNRRRLADAQAQFSRLLIAHHLAQPEAA